MKRFRPFILTEAQDYDGMFSDVIQFLPNIYGKKWINNEIKWAKRILKKNHRIIWYLRWYKLEKLRAHLTSNEKKKVRELFDNELQKYNKKTKGIKITHGYLTRSNFTTAWTSITDKLEHFMNSNISEINQTSFQWQLPHELLEDLEEIEKKFYSNQERATYIKKKTFLQLDKKWTWYDLEDTYSEEEQRMMIHCGNDSTGTLLSLRETIKVDKTIMYRPHLTFAFDPSTGILKQMKGYKNSKPKKEFHPQIMKLLLYNKIKKIKRGEYDTDNDFNIKDLSDRDYQKLSKDKPELIGSSGIFADLRKKWDPKKFMELLQSENSKLVKQFNISTDRLLVDTSRLSNNFDYEDYNVWNLPDGIDIIGDYYDSFTRQQENDIETHLEQLYSEDKDFSNMTDDEIEDDINQWREGSPWDVRLEEYNDSLNYALYDAYRKVIAKKFNEQQFDYILNSGDLGGWNYRGWNVDMENLPDIIMDPPWDGTNDGVDAYTDFYISMKELLDTDDEIESIEELENVVENLEMMFPSTDTTFNFTAFNISDLDYDAIIRRWI